MKKYTAVFSVLLIFALILSMGAMVWADGDPTKNDSITINNAKPGETYRAYKLFDLIVDSETNPTAYSYQVNSGWVAFFAAAGEETEAGAGNQFVTIDDTGYVTAISDPAALAKAAAAWSGKPAAVKSVNVGTNETTAVFTGLADGYWLITSTLGTIAMTETTPDAAAVTINEKNSSENSVVKKVREDSHGRFGEANDAQIGDTISFQSTLKIVKGTRNVVVHDNMDSGLTYTAGSVEVAGLTKGTEYTVQESPDDGDAFDIAFTQSWIDGIDFGTDGYKEYEITYTAILNENAVAAGGNSVSIVTQYNRTSVSYGNNASSSATATATTTHRFSVFKHAAGSADHLAGAVFSLKKAGVAVPLVKLDDNNYRVAINSAASASPETEGEGNTSGSEGSIVETFTTVASGDIVIWGVDSDNDYTLEEIQAPEGYNKSTTAISVTVDVEDTTRINVENKSGAELPETGGIGTTIFYVVGGIMVAAALVLLITRKRMGE